MAPWATCHQTCCCACVWHGYLCRRKRIEKAKKEAKKAEKKRKREEKKRKRAEEKAAKKAEKERKVGGRGWT